MLSRQISGPHGRSDVAAASGRRRWRSALPNPVEAALLGTPTHPEAEDIRTHAEAVADVLIAGIAV